MKTLFLIPMFLILVQANCFAQLELDPSRQTQTATTSYTVRVEPLLEIQEFDRVIDLGAFSPGQTIEYSGPVNSFEFKIKGEQLRKVMIHGKINNDFEDVKLNDIKWQYWDGNQWQDMQPHATGGGDYVDNFAHQLDAEGMTRVRVYPGSLTTSGSAEVGSAFDFRVEISCEYFDW